MAYTVNKTNSSASPNQYTVQDNVLNTQTDLNLVGKGYAGYGEVIAENFLHLLENFSNTTAPSKPIVGQLWFDSVNSKLKVYNGTIWQTAGGSAPFQSTAPSNLQQGDFWIDSDTSQLFFYNGSNNVLVGPPGATGTLNGFIYETIKDSTDANQNVTKWYNDGSLIAIISDDTFTPKSAISGFASITKGITLTTDIADLKLTGTSTDSDKLGGIAAANYLRSNANDTTAGTLGIVNDSGLTVGADSDLHITVDALGVNIQNVISDKNITFKVNDGGTTSTVMTVSGASGRIGIGTTSPATKLDILGTTRSTAFSGPLSGTVTDTTGSSTLNALSMNSTLTSKDITPATDATYDIGTSSLGYNVVYAKATSAQYADLAEKYTSDHEYEPGTVVIFSGAEELTVSQFANDTRVAGVVSTNPAYLMNDKEDGVAVALVGKVPCKVEGYIEKGDLLTTSGKSAGHAKKAIEPKLGSIIGKALENHKTSDTGVIFISIGKH